MGYYMDFWVSNHLKSRRKKTSEDFSQEVQLDLEFKF